MTEITLFHYLSLAAIIFTTGVIGIFLNRKNVIVLPKKELGIINSESFLIETSYGSCVIFPSTLMHSVLPNTTDEVRITLSFNVFVKGEMQGDDLSKLTI